MVADLLPDHESPAADGATETRMLASEKFISLQARFS
jgi:hypothetical protein